jgi:hypothetical protein
MRPDLDPGAPLLAYGLELRGARALQTHRARLAAERTDEPELVRWRKEYTRRTEWFLEHHVMISNFRCVLELALRETPGVELLNWDQGQETWLRVPIPVERAQFLRVAPDARFSLREADEVRHFFLEMDRSTEEHSRLLRKFQAYWWYLQSPIYQRADSNSRRVNVLIVTTGQQRMLNLIRTLQLMPKPNRAAHGGKGLFRFCLESDFWVTNPASVLRPIWRTAGSSGTGREHQLLGGS